MSTDSSSNRIPEEALNAFLDGILAELKSPADPLMLTKVRAIFRKRIPFNMRSYAAALLILRAAGITRNQPPKPNVAPPRAQREPQAARQNPPAPQPEKTRQTPHPRQAAPVKQLEGTVPLFVSMGKRQRLRPQELRDLITEKTGIPNEELGRVHLFDNYSFIDIQEAQAEKVIASVDGSPFRGRTIEIKPAKKKGDQPAAKDQTE